MTEQARVTRADRDAYFVLHLHTRSLPETDYRAIRFRALLDRGEYDHWAGVQAFARHRLASQRQGVDAFRLGVEAAANAVVEYCRSMNALGKEAQFSNAVPIIRALSTPTPSTTGIPAMPQTDPQRSQSSGNTEARDEARDEAGEIDASKPFQANVQPWLMACFGEMIAGDREERNHRFLEEALELVQACGCTASEAHQLVDYTFDRPVGELHQEVGGVMVTLAALCLANDADMHAAGWVELNRIWGKVEAIRAKQAAKPKHSPLPEHTHPPKQPTDADVADVISTVKYHLRGVPGEEYTDRGMEDAFFRWPIIERAIRAALTATEGPTRTQALDDLMAGDSDAI